MKRCVFSVTVLAACLQKKFGVIGRETTQAGVGTLMKLLLKSTMRNPISSAPSIMMGQCWKAMFQNAEIAAPLCKYYKIAFQILFSS
tara:strand:- start:2974 stop:3234 length:261 start_codon:yes stop_codon:yes gene_type:complete